MTRLLVDTGPPRNRKARRRVESASGGICCSWWGLAAIRAEFSIASRRMPIRNGGLQHEVT
jgi:hypothetical protein